VLTAHARVLQLGLPVAVFGLSKASVLFAPLLLTLVMPLAAYGALEADLAMAAILARILAGGMAAAVPFFLLKEAKPEFKNGILLYGAVVSGVVLALAVAMPAVTQDAFSLLPLLCAGIFAVQFILAAFMKVDGRASLASIIEAGIYLALLFIAITALLYTLQVGLGHLYWSLAVYVAVLGLGCLIPLLSAGQPLAHTKALLLHSLAYGLPLVLPGLGMLVVVNGGRVMAGYLLGPEATALYGFLFRLAAPAILVHHLLATLFFRQLYASAPNRLDRYFSAVTGAVLVVALVTYWVLPTLLSPYFPMLSSLDGSGKQTYLLLSIQMPIWIGMALLELIVARERQAWAQLRVMVMSAGLGAGTVLVLYQQQQLDLLRLCQVQLLVFIMSYGGMQLILRRAGVRLPTSAGTMAAIVALYAAYVLFVE
jgi:O-antigen/teichoic acid export membrane protein